MGICFKFWKAPSSLLIVCSVCFVYDVAAQSPGYLGKRGVFGYGFNASPAIIRPTFNNKVMSGHDGSAETGKAAFNTIHEVYGEYVIKTNLSLGFTARYYRTAFDNNRMLKDHVVSENNTVTYFNNEKRPKGYYTITGITYGFYFKYFGKQYVAPWGSYLLFGPVLNTATSKYDPTTMYIHGETGLNYTGAATRVLHDTLINNFGPIQKRHYFFNLMFGWGKTRIFYNRLIVDYGVVMQVLNLAGGIFPQKENEITNKDYIHKTTYRRLRGLNNFNAYLKIGILLF